MCWLGGVWVAPTPASFTIIISAGTALALGPALTVSSSCCFSPKLTPLLQLLIFLLGGRGLAGEGSPEDSAPSRQADLPQTPASTPCPQGLLFFLEPCAYDNSDCVTEYQSAGCVTHKWMCLCVCLYVCIRERRTGPMSRMLECEWFESR